MNRSSVIRRAAGAAVVLLGLTAAQGSAAIVTQWTFENYSTTAATLTNSPTPSTGTGTAGSIGMDGYPTPNPGVTTDDVLQGVAGDTGLNGNADTTNIFRVRAQAGTAGPANGWSSTAPIGAQGAQFFASTVGYNAINVSFDWYATNKGEANLQLEYTNDGTTWINVPIALSGSDADLLVLNNSTSTNTVMGSYVSGSAGQNWFTGLAATITDPLAANNPNFGIEMVNASTGADDVAIAGGALNNTSGNWRFDNVTINGTAVPTPEPASLGLIGVAGLTLLSRRRKMAC